MKAVYRMVVVVLFGIGSVSFAQPTTDAREGLVNLVVPVESPSVFLETARKALDDVLAGIPAKDKVLPQTVVLESGQFLLWGDLFKTGGCFALVELTGPREDESDFAGVALARWAGGTWELRGLWKIPTVWRPKGWKESGDDYLPVTPSIQPFELSDLSGDGVPEVIVAGEVAKYFQDNYLFRFSGKTNSLKLIASAMDKPEVVEKYVRLYFDSGSRSIYSEWQFFQWEGDELMPVASWHDEVGYGAEDPTFFEGERTDPRAKSGVIRVGFGKGQEPNADFYELTRNGKPFGSMRVKWRDEKVLASLKSDEIETAWLFEKITGLPRALCPRSEGGSPILRLEDFASVTIEGNEEAAKFFSAVAK